MEAPAGWHPDPDQYGMERYWDGTQWTGDRRQAPPAPPGACPQPGAYPPAGGYPPPQGAYPAGAYPPGAYPGYGYPPAAPQTNGKAIASLITGIVSIVMFWLGFIPGIVAIVLGRSEERRVGKG